MFAPVTPRCTSPEPSWLFPWRSSSGSAPHLSNIITSTSGNTIWSILRDGRKANPPTPEQRTNPCAKQSKEQNLLDRLEGYDEAILAFLWAQELPFTNNEAERAFRMMKVRVKISGCFRTLAGAQRHVRIRSYISTLRKYGLPVLEYLRRTLDGRPFLPQPAKST